MDLIIKDIGFSGHTDVQFFCSTAEKKLIFCRLPENHQKDKLCCPI